MQSNVEYIVELHSEFYLSILTVLKPEVMFL